MAVSLYDSTTAYNATLVGYDGLGDGVTTMPTLGVFIAFDGLPYDVEPVWTEVTTYVTNVEIDRGRSDDFSPFVSTAHVTFQNNTRQFDPFNTAGTYYGKLLPRKQIKIVAMNDGVLYPVFRGFVEGFPVQFTEAGYASTVSVQCFDLLALLATAQMPDYVLNYTNSLSPTHYWRCDDAYPASQMSDIGSLNMPLLQETGLPPAQIHDSLADGLVSKSMNLSNTQYSTFAGATPTWANYVSVAGNVSFAFWWSKNNPTADSSGGLSGNANFWGNLYNLILYGVVSELDVRAINSGSKLRAYLNDAFAGHQDVDTVFSGLATTTPVHIVVTYNYVSGVVLIYINGVDTSNPIYGVKTNGQFNPLNYVSVAGNVFQEISTYNKVLTPTEISNLYQHSIASIVETSAARFTRIIGYTNCSLTRTVVTSTPVATVSEMGKPNDLIVDELNKLVNAEYGFMFCDKNGKINFKDRNTVYATTKSNTSQATFGTGGIPFEPQIEMQYSGDQIRNDVTISFSGEGITKTTNTTSASAYGTHADTVDTQLSTIAQAKTLAAYVSTVAGNLTTNLSPLRIGVTKTTADYATILGLELLDRTTVVVTPQTGSSFTKIQLLNRITHSITPSSWDITVDGSEQYTTWFILDKSTLNGANFLQ